mmetsp:Transcript_1263/g.3515  ORF Transcript_1263/g.3515 Transcript_1263/m.3515 type:complete len:213 (-) Transcript_1263:251-889(-)
MASQTAATPMERHQTLPAACQGAVLAAAVWCAWLRTPPQTILQPQWQLLQRVWRRLLMLVSAVAGPAAAATWRAWLQPPLEMEALVLTCIRPRSRARLQCGQQMAISLWLQHMHQLLQQQQQQRLLGLQPLQQPASTIRLPRWHHSWAQPLLLLWLAPMLPVLLALRQRLLPPAAAIWVAITPPRLTCTITPMVGLQRVVVGSHFPHSTHQV